ncbi:MAG: Nramp family divalent metal transporter [Pirellulales bacterium]|nr:Nramp family divalent metal transporter [Pirellulales bacterium]
MNDKSAPDTIAGSDDYLDPPSRPSAILRNLGPGAIIAASIVGSGELIATTKTGAEAGFWLLWLIVLGCVIKVFVQVELGRFTVGHGASTLDGLNQVPGPKLRVRWIVWFWLAMFFFSLGQLGGIVGGVGQCLSLTLPITGDFAERVEIGQQQARFDRGLTRLDDEQFIVGDDPAGPTADELQGAYREIGRRPVVPERLAYTWDDVIWSAIVTVVTLLLLRGRYGMIERFCMVLVCLFTLLTVINVLALQFDEKYAMSLADIGKGFQFRLPPVGEALVSRPLVTALAAFGIIGVGATELIYYPYWCLEKGYAKHVGPRQDTDAWRKRAWGWMRVMRWDAFASMAVYTLATVAFYLLGAAVLHREGMNPGGHQLIDTLAKMYEHNPFFGSAGRALFLGGAVFVLYSTFFVAQASNARVAADAVDVFKRKPHEEKVFARRVSLFCWAFPILSLIVYLLSKDPVKLVLLSGVMQAIMLPMLAIAAVFFRYRRCDERLTPGKAWDIGLWLSLFAMLACGAYIGFVKGGELINQIVTTINW